jgi:hypothetical protein
MPLQWLKLKKRFWEEERWEVSQRKWQVTEDTAGRGASLKGGGGDATGM